MPGAILRSKKAILVGALLGAYGALWWHLRQEFLANEPLFSKPRTITAVAVKNGYSLSRTAEGWQTADGLKADTKQVEDILTALGELKKRPLPQESESEGLSPRSIIGELTVTERSGQKTVLLGQRTPDGKTRTAWLPGDEQGFSLDEGILKRITKRNPVLGPPLRFQPSQVRQITLQQTDLPSITLERNGPQWLVQRGSKPLIADTELVRRLLDKLSQLNAPPLLIDPSSAPEDSRPTPQITADLAFHNAPPKRFFFTELDAVTIRAGREERSTSTILQIEGDKALYELEERLPPELRYGADGFRDRSLLGQLRPRLTRADIASLCVLRDEIPSFELVAEGRHWSINTGCGFGSSQSGGRPAATPLVGQLLRLRVESYLPLAEGEPKTDARVRFLLTTRERGEGDKKANEQLRYLSISLNKQLDAAPDSAAAWEIGSTVDEEVRAIIPAQTAQTLLTEIRILESRLSS